MFLLLSNAIDVFSCEATLWTAHVGLYVCDHFLGFSLASRGMSNDIHHDICYDMYYDMHYDLCYDMIYNMHYCYALWYAL